jgi:serine O-acetyltransferase
LAKQGLTQDFDAHIALTFVEVPESPPLAHAAALTRRWFVVAFAQSWLAIWLYRLRQRARDAGVPLAPGICSLLSRILFNVQIGERVRIGRGLMLTHGNVVIDGRTRIGRNCQINPWVTIGLTNSRKLGFSLDGPTIGDHVHIGTGAKILGPVTIGDYVRIGANAVVVDDVPANVTVVGMPARVRESRGRQRALPARGSAPSDDEVLIERMLAAIVDFRLHRRSLRSLADTVAAAFAAGSAQLRQSRDAVRHDIAFLDTIAAAGVEDSNLVRSSLDDVEAALRAAARRPPAPLGLVAWRREASGWVAAPAWG